MQLINDLILTNVGYSKARIRSFLYEGIENFGLTAVVEGVPALLHAAVFLFFAGLVEFMFPINKAVASTVLSIAIICAVLYGIITVLPIMHWNSPYRTPLSDICWRVCQTLGFLRFPDAMGKYVPIVGNMAEVREMVATTNLPGRYERDMRALHWTMESLTEASELDPFVEGISKVLSVKYRTHDEISGPLMSQTIRDLLIDPHVDLLARIVKLLGTCVEGGQLSEETRNRRATASINAITSLFRDISMSKSSSPLVSKFSSQLVYIGRALTSLQKDNVVSIASMAQDIHTSIVEKLQTDILTAIQSERSAIECQPTVSDSLYALDNFDSILWVVQKTPNFTLSGDLSCCSSFHYGEFVQALRTIYIPRHLTLIARQLDLSAKDGQSAIPYFQATYVTACHFQCRVSNKKAFTETVEGLMSLAKSWTPTIAHYAICTALRLAYHIQCDIVDAFRTPEAFEHRDNDMDLYPFHSLLHSLDVLDHLQISGGDTRGQFRLWHPHFTLPGQHRDQRWDSLRDFVRCGDGQLLGYTSQMSTKELQRLTEFRLCTTGGTNTSDFTLSAKIVLSQGRTVALIALLHSIVIRPSPSPLDLEITLDILQLIGKDLTVRFASRTAQSLVVEMISKAHKSFRRRLSHLSNLYVSTPFNDDLSDIQNVYGDPFKLSRKSNGSSARSRECMIKMILIFIDILGTVGDPETLDQAKITVEKFIHDYPAVSPQPVREAAQNALREVCFGVFRCAAAQC
jgi:hypothetical protein